MLWNNRIITQTVQFVLTSDSSHLFLSNDSMLGQSHRVTCVNANSQLNGVCQGYGKG